MMEKRWGMVLLAFVVGILIGSGISSMMLKSTVNANTIESDVGNIVGGRLIRLLTGRISDEDIANDANINSSKIRGCAWTSLNDGNGSGLDADKLDGIHGDQFLRSDVSDTMQGNLTLEGNLHVSGNITFPPKTRYYTIPCYAFTPSDSETPFSYGGGVLINPDTRFTWHMYISPVNLPDGAIVTGINITYSMPDPYATARIYFEKMERNVVSTIIDFSLPRTGSSLANYGVTLSEEIDGRNSYWIRIYMDPNDSPSDILLASAHISYTLTELLP